MRMESSENTNMQRTYTAEQIAQILGISVRKAYDLGISVRKAYDFCATTKEFKVIRIGKRCVRVHKESFEKWLESQCDAQ